MHYYPKFPTGDCEDGHHDHIDRYRTGTSDVQKRCTATPRHQAGEKIELDLLPNGRGMLKAARPTGTIDGFIGLLADRTQKVATIEEINAATAQGWAGKE